MDISGPVESECEALRLSLPKPPPGQRTSPPGKLIRRRDKEEGFKSQKEVTAAARSVLGGKNLACLQVAPGMAVTEHVFI
jgi:hypothetical protein